MGIRISPRGSRGTWVLTALLVWAFAAPAFGDDAFVVQASGTIERGRGTPPRWQPLAEGDALAPGDRVRTGRDGRAELVWLGATIRMYGDSLVLLPEGDAANGVDLESGSSLFDVEHQENGSFEVKTPDVVVSVKGTRFGVSQADGPPEVSVYHGTVGVRAPGSREVLVREGFRAIGGAEAPAEIFLLDHPDPWEHWLAKPQPRTAMASPPARLADDSAHRSVRHAAKDRALTLALKRNPKLADRLVEVRTGLRRALDRKNEADAADDSKRLLADVDPLLDAPTGDVERMLKSEYIEEVLNAPGNSVDVVLSRSGVIEILDPSLGQTWQLDQNTLVDILEGTSSLPAGLDSALGVMQPEDQTEVVTVLLGVLGR